MKPTYTKRKRDGSAFGDPVKYDPLIVLSGTQAHRLALHKDCGAWVVAHPESGARVCDVRATYKGVPVSSKGLTLAQAMNVAMAHIDAMIERMGSDRFNAVLQAAADAAKEPVEA